MNKEFEKEYPKLSQSDIENCPNKILVKVFSYLKDKAELAKLGEICKRFYKISRVHQLQKSLPWPLLDYTHPLFNKSRKLKARGDISCLIFLTEQLIVCGYEGYNNNVLRVWDIKTGTCIQTLVGHKEAIRCVTRISDNIIVSGSSDQTLRIWNVATGECINTLAGHTGGITCVLQLSDNTIISSAGSFGIDTKLRIWDILTGECIKQINAHQFTNRMVKLADNTIIIGSSSGEVCKLNTLTGELTHLWNCINRINDIAILSDSIIAISSGSTIKIVNITTKEVIKNFRHDTSAGAVAKLTDDNSILVSSGHCEGLTIWSLQTRKPIIKIPGGTMLSCITKLPDNIIAYSEDSSLNILPFARFGK